MRTFSNFAKAVIRFMILWAVDGLSLLITAFFFSGINFVAQETTTKMVDAFAAAFLLGIVNLLIRPLVLLLGSL